MYGQLSVSDSGSRSGRGGLRRVGLFVSILAIVGLALLAIGYASATSDPVIRKAKISLAGWPANQRPLRIVLVSDIHVAGPDMPPVRVNHLVELINRLHPDVIMLAGDFISDKSVATRRYSLRDAVAPLKGLHPRLGLFAVLGNHDHWRNADEARAVLRGAGIVVLNNGAARAGPLVIGGLDDDFTGNANLKSTIANMRHWTGPMILLSHSPDPFPDVPGEVQLMLAGHTHCGQIVLPLVGALATMSRFGDRYACGLVREGGKTLIVGAGLGTSLLPLRFGAPPDLWLIEVGR